jgi:uncharacterized membrane protein
LQADLKEKLMGKLDAGKNQRYVALTLRYGSVISTLIMALGLSLLMVREAVVPFLDPSGAGPGALSGLGVRRAALVLMRGGILLLLLTPVFRVVLATVSFALEGDRQYVLISLGVLLIVLLSIGYSFKV